MAKTSRASRSVRVVVPEDRRSRAADRGRPRKTFLSRVMRTNAIIADNIQADEDYRRNLAGLDEQTTSAIAAMRGEQDQHSGPSYSQHDFDDPMNVDPQEDDADSEWEEFEDGVEVADEAMQEVLEFAKQYRQYDDKRTWRQRIQRADEHWQQVMPVLVGAYLRWRYPPLPSPEGPSPASTTGSTTTSSASGPAPSLAHAPTPAPASASVPAHTSASAPAPTPTATSAPAPPASSLPEPLAFEIDVYNVFDVRLTAQISSTTASTHVEALALNGYLSATPIRASVAISFSTLELLRCIRLFKASYSIESFAKLVCYYYRIPYRRTVRNWISDAFDIYLAILCDVKKQMDRELGRDSPNWRVRNSCPACCYALADEQPRKFSRMYCMDGNNSLKRMRPLGGRKAGDVRVFQGSDYFLPQDYVDTFANEVRVKLPGKGNAQAVPEAEGDPSHAGEGVDVIPPLTDRDSPAPDDPQRSTCPPLPLNQPCADMTAAGDLHPLSGPGVRDSEHVVAVPLDVPDDLNSPRPPLPLNSPCDATTAAEDLRLPLRPGVNDSEDVNAIPNDPDSTPAVSSTPPHSATQGDIEGDPTDGAGPSQSSCTKNWKAAQSDDKKRSWDVFEETGIFASACRHGFILWIIDMVRSGELARYPLATVAKVLEVIGDRTLGGYDVGCTLEGTVRRSSLGKRFDELHSRICVNAFHGYSHEYSCQVKHHPNGIEGIGLEDLETLERIFSASNALAAIIRYASPFRRRVLIDAFFQQWDDDKYLNLGKMLYDNYRQALAIIKEQDLVVADAMQSLGMTPEHLTQYAAEEREYLNSLGKESPQDLHEIAYVKALQELRAVKAQLARTNRRFLASGTPAELTFMPPHSGPTDYEAETSRTRKIETERRYLDDRRKVLTLEVADLEVRLGLHAQWQPSDPDYMRVSQYIATRKYQKALSNLQRLIIQRLFELHKMNLARTGYRMRRHIAKNMQTRSRALRNAIQSYNTAAAALDPPRPSLEWEKISHYQLLQEFELMNETRADIREKPWAQPAVRETVRLAQRLERAREEIVSVNADARRVHTAIRDENVLFSAVLARLEHESSPLHGAMHEFVTRRRAANAHVLVTLQKLYALPEYSGNPTPGVRAGAADPLVSIPETAPDGFHQVVQAEADAVEADEKHGEDAGVEDDEVQGELTDLSSFLGSLSI